MTRILPPRRTKHFNADVLEADLRLWKGTPAIGLEIAKAKQHADVLYQEFYKRPASDVHRAITDIFQVRSDPRGPLQKRAGEKGLGKTAGSYRSSQRSLPAYYVGLRAE